MTVSKEWQLQRDAAEQYEDVLVRSILGPFARLIVDRSELQVGQRVLDVGCGTGAATRYAAEKVGTTGRVAGLDVNPGMIDVAKSLPPVSGVPIVWIEKSAYELPFADGEFDVVLSAQVLQFLTDRPLAMSQMHRVLAPGGRVCCSHWCDIRENPYFCALLDTLSEHLGRETAAGLEAAFTLSDPELLLSLLRDAGFREPTVTAVQLELPLPALDEFVPRHIDATPLATAFRAASAQDRRGIVDGMAERLSEFGSRDAVRVPFTSLVAVAHK